MKEKPLTAIQQELLEAMRSGVVVRYMPYMGRFNQNAYYWRGDTRARCTAPAKALVDRRLVKIINADWRGHRLEPVSAPSERVKE